MTTVEYRSLRFTFSHRTADAVTVAVVVWDGAHLRIATGLKPLVSVFNLTELRDIATLVRAHVRAASRALPASVASVGQRKNLSDFFSVQEGLGGSLDWRPTVRENVSDADAFFGQLIGELHLAEGEPSVPSLGMPTIRLIKNAPDQRFPSLQTGAPPIPHHVGLWAIASQQPDVLTYPNEISINVKNVPLFKDSSTPSAAAS